MTDREQFEAWASPILDSNSTWKESGDCELAWQAWQAARAQSSTPNPVEVGTTVQAGQVLTDDEIDAVYIACRIGGVQDFARAIEAAVLAKRVPMTDAQIDESMRAKFYPARNRAFVDGVEAAERHHGIVGEKGGAL